MENNILEIIIRILKGEAYPEDRQKLTEWLARNKENIEFFKQSESVWNALDIIERGNEFNSEEAFNRFKDQVRVRLKASRRIGLYKAIDWFLRVAAVLVILLGISYFLISNQESQKIPEELSSCEIIAPRGSKTQLLLPDGTQIWLNSESKIHYLNDFNRTDREVFLEGEGYFIVANNPEKPFIVNASTLKVRALGTTFNIKSYPSEETIEATLIEGKIEVENTCSKKANRFTVIEPNQKITYFKGKDNQQDRNQSTGEKKTFEEQPVILPFNKVVINEKVDPCLITSWKNNVIFFDNEMFQDLALRLERRFAVKIHFMEEDIKQLRFTGRFPDIIIEQVLVALQFASPFYYSFNDKDIYISKYPIKEIPLKSNPIN